MKESGATKENVQQNNNDQNEQLQQILQLTTDCRLLAAKTLYDELLESLVAVPNAKLSDELQNNSTIQQMLQRENDARDLLSAGNVLDSSWLLGSVLFGNTTHYKLQEDGTMTVRLEGEFDDMPLFEQLAVIHEVDLFQEWMPFCSNSILVDKVGPAELLCYMHMFIPPIKRDTLMHAHGVDCLMEHGKILLLGGSIDDWVVPSSEGSRPHAAASSSSSSSSGNTHDTHLLTHTHTHTLTLY